MRRLRALQALQRHTEQRLSSSLQVQRWMSAQPAPAQQDDMIEVTVNGSPVKIAKGSNVLQACEAAGVDVPR